MNIIDKIGIYLCMYNDDYSNDVDELLEKIMKNGWYVKSDRYYIYLKYKNKIIILWNANKPYGFLSHAYIKPNKYKIENGILMRNFSKIYYGLRPSRNMIIRFVEWLETQGYNYNKDFSEDGFKGIE